MSSFGSSCEDMHVVKVGGSLLDYERLVEVVERFIELEGGSKVLIVVGGARSADAVRTIDRNYGLDEERAHWLAVRGMSLNAYLLAEVLDGAELVDQIGRCESVWEQGGIAIVEPIAWLESDEANGCGVEHCWLFTSDSIAAHVAKQIGTKRLTMLKSTLPVEQLQDAEHAASIGLVDGRFAEIIPGIENVTLINGRSEAMEAMTLNAGVHV
ncbi:hypothetical protein JD969_06085 [Planctomycetota bacterium]|nr:hypothetical protein JD969_06085 [Planctomycetota bacterium]